MGPRSEVNSARLPAKWRKLAEERCADLNERITPARLAAYAELLASKGALTAYELIALLEKRQGRKIAPLTVYRNLDFLIRVGLVHRLESTQSYLPCSHPAENHESQYLLCSNCGEVKELESRPLVKMLEKIASDSSFQRENTVVEIQGLCQDCHHEADD